MGYRLYVHKRHIIEYDGGYFNWKNQSINEILSSFCAYNGNSDTTFSADDEIEVSRESFKAMLEKFKDVERIPDILEEEGLSMPEGYSPQMLYDALKSLYDSADPNNDYIFMSWF